MLLPIAATIAVRETRRLAESALPGAPVVTDVTPVPVPGRRRLLLARALRRLADRVEPAPVDTRACCA